MLFDIVESDKLIIFTGAGFSRGFKRKDGSFIPGWIDLLNQIKERFDSESIIVKDLSGKQADSLIKKFMNEPFPRGENLIEVATILRRADRTLFDKLVEEFLTPQDPPDPSIYAEYKKKHDAIMKLSPKGIITVNVDKFHEIFLEKNNYIWTIHDPINEEESDTIRIFSRLEERPFLIKAHGTIGKKIVFDYLSYRDLLEKSPAYNALFVHLFSHYRILFIGFGLSDLDFDMTIEKVVRKIGAPLQQHLTLQIKSNNRKTVKNKIGKAINTAKSARLEERFGIISLEMAAADIPELLKKATSVPGSKLEKLIKDCTSDDIDIRKRAHLDIRLLGTVGKRIAMNYIYKEVTGKLSTIGTKSCKKREIHSLSELTYSLGSIGLQEPEDIKRLAKMLLDIAEKTKECEIVAHALWALFPIAGYVDGTRLKRLRCTGHINNLRKHRGFKAPKERCIKYLDALIARSDAEALS
jgi:hypothetical protein